MNQYQLAKLIEWAGTLESRKRIQKVVFMLQAAHCPFMADFFLHRYGPYSQDVAQLTDEMVAAGLLKETESDNGMGGRIYGYQLTERGQSQLKVTSEKSTGQKLSREMEGYRSLAKKLLDANLRDLEVAATIVFFHLSQNDWETAKKKAFQFKEVDSHSEVAARMEKLAKEVVD